VPPLCRICAFGSLEFQLGLRRNPPGGCSLERSRLRPELAGTGDLCGFCARQGFVRDREFTRCDPGIYPRQRGRRTVSFGVTIVDCYRWPDNGFAPYLRPSLDPPAFTRPLSDSMILQESAAHGHGQYLCGCRKSHPGWHQSIDRVISCMHVKCVHSPPCADGVDAGSPRLA